jgi:hypothetical protein
MVELDLSIVFIIVHILGGCHRFARPSEKKAGVVEHPEVFDHAGILVNGPPGPAGLPFN